MKFPSFFLFVICLLMACSQEPATTEVKAAITSGPTDEVDILGILYSQNQILERWQQFDDGSIFFIDSIKVNTIPSFSLGKYAIAQENEQVLLRPIDSLYPFAFTPSIVLDQNAKEEYFLNKDQPDSTNNLQTNQLWVVPSRLRNDGQFEPSFAACPVQVARHIYLAKELRGLLSKQTYLK